MSKSNFFAVREQPGAGNPLYIMDHLPRHPSADDTVRVDSPPAEETATQKNVETVPKSVTAVVPAEVTSRTTSETASPATAAAPAPALFPPPAPRPAPAPSENDESCCSGGCCACCDEGGYCESIGNWIVEQLVRP